MLGVENVLAGLYAEAGSSMQDSVFYYPFSSVSNYCGLSIALNSSPPIERIWPFGDLFGVFPHHVVFAEEEEGAVESQTVLPNRNGVVECHGTGSLGHRLFIYPLGPWGTTLPNAPSTPATSAACCSRASSP